MKVLSINSESYVSPNHEVINSSLYSSTPFGYDVIVVNPSNSSAMYGANSTQLLNTRWKNSLEKWSDGKRKIIIFLDGASYHSLLWLPIPPVNLVTFQSLESAGNSNYLGNILSTDPVTRRFLTQNKDHFNINTHLNYDSEDENLTVNSSVDSSILTSFNYSIGNLEVIFIPTTAMSNLQPLLDALDTPANAWGISGADDLLEKMSSIDQEINELNLQRDVIYANLNAVNTKISETISSDVYLTRAISHYDATKSTEQPSPESYYGAVEAVENAFVSEREMREELGLTKSYVDKVMRRANDFRHEAKSGQSPSPLSDEEIQDLNQRVNHIISSYIQYLLKKS